jgi:hypothetical protein
LELSSWEAYQSNQTFFGSLTAQRVKYYFRKYETARRIAEQQEIERSETYLDPRGTHEDNDLQPSILKAAENSQDSIEEIWEEIKVWEDLL